MPRPSRTDEALEVLRTYYAEEGVLPSMEVLTRLMGYRSSSSAFDVTKKLVQAGYLDQEGRQRRLKPGPLFNTTHGSPDGLLPKGCLEVVATVASAPELGVLVGDALVYRPNALADTGEPVVVRTPVGITLVPSANAKDLKDTVVLGSAFALYRRYRI